MATSQIDDSAAFGGAAALRSGACGGSALSLARARGGTGGARGGGLGGSVDTSRVTQIGGGTKRAATASSYRSTKTTAASPASPRNECCSLFATTVFFCVKHFKRDDE